MRGFISPFFFVAIAVILMGYASMASAQGMREDTMFIVIGDTRFEVVLYDNNAARSLLESLPQSIDMSAWGDEFYGRLSQPINHDGDAERDVFEIGEVALWPSGNALCIFFGPTPASRAEEPRMASPGVPFGKIKGDASSLKDLRGSLRGVKLSVE